MYVRVFPSDRENVREILRETASEKVSYFLSFKNVLCHFGHIQVFSKQVVPIKLLLGGFACLQLF